MKLASHNSFTYFKVGFWAWFIKWTAKCQKKTIQEQYDLGVRMFDLRVWFNKNMNIEFRHGIVKYKVSHEEVYDLLKYLNDKGDCYVRVILEENNIYKKKSYVERSENQFKGFCNTIEKSLPNIKFFGGLRKYDFELLYEFNESYPDIHEYNTSSLWPWIGAKLHNKKNIANHSNEEQWAMFDFVEIN